MHIHTSTLVPDDTSQTIVIYRNRGTTTLSGNVTVAIDPHLQYMDTLAAVPRLSPAFPQAGLCAKTDAEQHLSTGRVSATAAESRWTANTTSSLHTYPYTGLQPFQQRMLRIRVRTPPNAALIGTTVTNTATAFGYGGGGTVDNDTEVKTIRGSHDPNNKECTTTTLTPAEVQQGKPIRYTINFENTGTWHAKWVVIEDTLSNYLDYRTLRTLSTSHLRYRVRMEFDTVSVQHKVVVKWIFPNIGLKYKALSSLEAQGFVEFSIQAKPTTPLGAIIKNTGYIYFDVNPAVITEPVYLTVQHPLPVEWLTVNAEAQSVNTNRITWATASETNNQYFTIERSTDGEHFIDINKQIAHNTNTGAQYNYTDTKISGNDILYYRISQTDFDGTKSYSKTVSVSRKAKQTFFTASPNPTANITVLTFATPLRENARLNLINSTGQIVMTLTLPANITTYLLSLSDLPQGIYTLHVQTTDGKTMTDKMVKM